MRPRMARRTRSFLPPLAFNVALIAAVAIWAGGCAARGSATGTAGASVTPAAQPAAAVTSSAVVPAAAGTSAATQSSIAAAEARRREVLDLIDEATRGPTESARGAAAFDAADRATTAVADTLRSIAVARDVCLANLRNLETTAYKSVVIHLADGHVSNTQLNLEQGSLENTGRPLDVGIQGLGYFKVRIADSIGGGVAYTRNGNFFVNHNSELVLGMGDGYKLLPPITLPSNASDISISQAGRVEIIDGATGNKRQVGQIQLTTFVNAGGLHNESLSGIGGALYTATSASGPPIDNVPGDNGSGQLVQNFLEASNVDLIRERIRIRFLNDWETALLRAVEGIPKR